MNPLIEIDLQGQWHFAPETGSRTEITVPGGGWLKQGFDCEAGTYDTCISIPDVGQPQITVLELGAVNHYAEYYIGENKNDLVKIYEEVTAFTAQRVDLTPYVRPGGSYWLKIIVRAYKDGRPIAPHWAEWNECIARGIFRSAHIRIYPDVFISDVFIKTSVINRELDFDMWISNHSSCNRSIKLTGKVLSWNGDVWHYPEIQDMDLIVNAGETMKVSVSQLEWAAPKESFWWPNMPYREGYRAKLHVLHLSLSEHGKELYNADTRFGFRELRQTGPYFSLNDRRINFRGDNLQVANYDRIDCGGRGDAIDTLPGFLPPTDTNPGWPKAVDNFLRLNYNVQREHMGPWSPYMIDTCDEMGLMLIGESACRWEGFDMENGRGWHEVKCLRDIIIRDRNHPSIIRWSSKNEAQSADPEYHLQLYDAIKELDDTRPVFEDFLYVPGGELEPHKAFSLLLEKDDFTWMDHYFSYNEKNEPYFTPIQHNDAILPMRDRPFGITEANWMRSSTQAGLSWFATTVALGRARDASDLRPYVLLSSWASSVPGVQTTDFLTEENRHPVWGEDNLPDPWTHPGIQLLQKAYHPLLAMDYDFWWQNRKCDMFGHFPVVALQVQANAAVTREITVFNDEFEGEELELAWEIHEGSNANWVWERGSVPLIIATGYAVKVPITFMASRFNTYLFMTFRVFKGGVERFADSLTCFEVIGGEDFRSEFNGEERKFL